MPLGKLRIFCICYFSKTKTNQAKIIIWQCFATEMKVACNNYSANLEQETETTKIVTYPLFPLASSVVVYGINSAPAVCACFYLDTAYEHLPHS